MASRTYAALDLDARRAISYERLRLWISARLDGLGEALSVALGSWNAAGFAQNSSVYIGTPGTDALEIPLDAPLSSGLQGSLELQLMCDRPEDRPSPWSSRSSGDCFPGDAVPLEVRGLEMTLREDLPPSGVTRGGTLVSVNTVGGVASLDYSASDQESGLLRIEALIDGAVVAAKDLKNTCMFADFTACPTVDQGSIQVDTRQFINGRHVASLRVTDAAGNRFDEPGQQIEVQNAAVVSPSPSAGSGIELVPADAAKLTARIAGSSRSAVIVPYGRRVVIRGRLTRADRSPLVGARVAILERLARTGSREVQIGEAQTRSDGTFSYALARMQPSRTVRASFGATLSSRLLRMRVRAASTLDVSLRGTRMRYSGVVLSRPIPRSGKRVILEGKAPGFEWAPFAAMRTDRRGRFAGSYRLPVRRPGVRLRIRVRVPTERGYPYLGFTSRPDALSVR